MATISLAELSLLNTHGVIPLVYSVDGQVKEPFFDYDEEGNPKDFGLDLEPEDPTAEELLEAKDKFLYNVAPSQFAELAIQIPAAGKISAFRFEGREYLRRIYDSPADKILLTCGRQVEKSTTLGNRLLCYSALVNNFRALFVAPSAEQAKVFSVDRIRDVIECSPLLQAYVPPKIGQAVFFKKFVNFSQIRLRYAYLTADRVRGIPADLICYATGTEVLTRLGWRRVEQLTQDDLVADVSDAGEVEWHHPTRVFSRKHTGEMVTFAHSKMRLRVTGDHNMWINYRVKHDEEYKTPDRWQFVTASELAATARMGFKVTCSATWLGEAPLYREFAGIAHGYGDNRRGIKLSYPHLAALTGWYIAEGHIQWADGKYPRPVISQNEGRYLDEILTTVENLGLTYRTHKDPRSDCHHVIINSGILGHYFAELGHARDKYIPREFFDYPMLLELLLKALYLGDACYHADESWDEGTLRTRSRRLAEDVQEAWLRLRRPAVIHTRSSIPAHQRNPNYMNLAAEPLYEICAYKHDYFVFWKSEFQSKQRVVGSSVIDEDVHCFTVPNHRPIVKGSFGAQPIISGQCVDELQDILVDNIPIIEQCAFHSPYKLFLYSGTPKSEDNTIAHYWSEFSTQNEWIVPCERHGTPGDPSSWHWNVLTETNIGAKSLVCDRCYKPIDARHPLAKWAAMNPKTESNKDKVTFEGYRIPQIMVPWVDWDEIIEAQEQYPRALFMNEKLGMSYDSGVRPITRGQLQTCCKPHVRMTDIENFKQLAQGKQVFAGVDWGTGEGSYTVISFGGYFGTGNFCIFWVHRFTGQDLEPERQLDVISQMISQLRVHVVGVDYGGGFHPNDTLIRRFGPQKIVKYQYNPRQKKKIYWEPNLNRYMCHRSEVMSDIFNALKRKLVDLPCWEDFADPYGQDILNVFSEYNQRLRMTEYKHAPGKTDDTFHSILYCALASMILNPRPDIIRPIKETGIPPFVG